MNKKEEVINAARDLFTKYGYKKVSMDEIAKEANVTKKLFILTSVIKKQCLNILQVKNFKV